MSQNIHLQKLLAKIAIKRFIDNFAKVLNGHSITHLELSQSSGKPDNAFNKTVNEAEDPRLSTFLRYWISLEDILKTKGKEFDVDFNQLIDGDTRKIIHILKDAHHADLNEIVKAHSQFLLGLKIYFDLLSRKNVLTTSEVEIYHHILKMIHEQEDPYIE